MFKKILVLILLFVIHCLLFTASFVQSSEESITITTYYPSPYGNYREMRATRIAIGDGYINGSNYCWPGETCTNTINADADLVVEGNVGIGTTTPSVKLEVNGQVKITGGSPADGKVLISDANGLASWGGTDSVDIYKCPNNYSCDDGQYINGDWASYGCIGQISSISSCTNAWHLHGSKSCSNVCTYLGKVVVR